MGEVGAYLDRVEIGFHYSPEVVKEEAYLDRDLILQILGVARYFPCCL